MLRKSVFGPAACSRAASRQDACHDVEFAARRAPPAITHHVCLRSQPSRKPSHKSNQIGGLVAHFLRFRQGPETNASSFHHPRDLETK